MEFLLASPAKESGVVSRQDAKTPRIADLRRRTSKQVSCPDNQLKPACTVDAHVIRTCLEPASTSTSGYEGTGNIWKEGHLPEAVAALDHLVERGISVDTSVFYRLLKRCIARKDLSLGKRVQVLARRRGYESNVLLANHIICMYASHGRLEEANQVFNKIASPNAFIWASIILAHARQGQPTVALKLYERMRETTVKPDNHIFVAALKACSIAADLESGRKVHADILRSSHSQPGMFVGSSLVDMYAKCGSLQDARRVFDTLLRKNVVTWTAMISGYAQQGFGQEALALYSLMQQDKMSPATDHVTFVCLLQACASARDLHQGKQLHAQIQQRKLDANLVVGNCLVDMYSKCGSLEDARKVFDELPEKDVVTWNTMMAGYAEHGLCQQALDLHALMQQDCVTVPDPITFVSLLQACTSVGALDQGKELHAQIQEGGLEGDMVVGNSLLSMYTKCGSLEDAGSLFHRLPAKDVVTWTTMITCYAQHGLGREALLLYADMQQHSMIPADSVTFVCLLQVCASIGALREGKQLHAQIQERRLESNGAVGNSLVDMYAKCGRLMEARQVLKELPTRDVVTWNALLNGYAEHGNGQLAMQCFQEMQQQGVKPDGATFASLLVACSHEGLVDEGQQYFSMMVADHGITPTVQHYNCMVDLLGRSGLLNDAEQVLQTMPFDDSVVGWTSLLSACKSHGNVELAQRCFDHLVRLEPENATAYVLLSSMYASAGRWHDADRVEGLRKRAGAKKKPAKACIEVQSNVHEFSVGEEKADITPKSRSINQRVKEGGHVPHTDLVLKTVSESAREHALCGHAEKLALAYGLLHTPNGTPLLVTKNLRMCDDCHSSSKIMSRLENREIIVRDAHRVHLFVDGSCSCGDRS